MKKGTIRRQDASFGSSTDSQQPEPSCVRTIQGHNCTFTPSWHNHRLTCTLVTSVFWTSGSCLTCGHIVSQSSGQLCDEITKSRTGDKACKTEQREVAEEVSVLLSQTLSPLPSPSSQKQRTPQPTQVKTIALVPFRQLEFVTF